MAAFECLQSHVLAHVLDAAAFAAEKHRDQRRKDAHKTPYINHPLGVALLIAREGGISDVATLQGALLHEHVLFSHIHTHFHSTVEDTATTFEELEQRFGKRVADIVRQVTDDKSLSKDARKKAQIEHAAHASPEAKLIKLADKLYNLRDLLTGAPASWDAERIQGYFVWADAVLKGVRGTNTALEKLLDEVFASHFTHNGKSYPVLPQGDREAFLQKYYASMAAAKD